MINGSKLLLIFIINLSILISIVKSNSICLNKNLHQVQNTKAIVSNGCSKPPGFQIEGEEDFTYCCDKHDMCYEICGASQSFCDKEFDKCMKSLCKTNFPSNKQCSQAASMYSMGTSMFGGDAFENSQQEYCECVESNNVIDHYKKLIDEFYINNINEEDNNSNKNSDSILKIDKYKKLLKNEGNNDNQNYPKIHKILYDLYKKYHNAIGHIENRINKKPPIPKISKKKEKEL